MYEIGGVCVLTSSRTFLLFKAQLVSLVPIFGTFLLYVHMSLLYSLYAFEYTWTNLGEYLKLSAKMCPGNMYTIVLQLS